MARPLREFSELTKCWMGGWKKLGKIGQTNITTKKKMILHSIISHAPLLTYGLEKAISPDMLTECRSLTVRLLSKMFERNSRSTCAAKGWKDSTVLGSLCHHRFVGSRSHAPSLFFQTRSNTCGIRGTLIRPVEECTH